MNLFETIKEKVSVPDAAKRYGLRTAHHDMAICPFHDDRHPSLRLNRDYFYCYGCGAHGDVIGLVSRLFGLSPYEASLKLASDFGIDLDKPLSDETQTKTGHGSSEPHPLARSFREDELYCCRVVCDYLHLLEDWKERYAPVNMYEEPDDRYVEACQMLDYMEHLADLLLFSDPDTRMVTVMKMMSDGKIVHMEDLVRRAKQEEGKEVPHEEESLAG